MAVWKGNILKNEKFKGYLNYSDLNLALGQGINESDV